jgi:predicted Zn-dependent protease
VPVSNSDFTPGELANLDSLVKAHYQQKLAYFTRPKAELLQDVAQLEENAQYYAARAKTISPDNVDTLDRVQSEARLSLTQARQLKEAAQGKLPTDFAFDYSGYGDRTGKNEFTNDPAGWGQTLGRFRYKVDPSTGAYEVYDSYDFNNRVHKYRAEAYSKMSPPARMGNALADTFLAGNQYAFGEAYLSGKNSVPISIRGRVK